MFAGSKKFTVLICWQANYKHTNGFNTIFWNFFIAVWFNAFSMISIIHCKINSMSCFIGGYRQWIFFSSIIHYNIYNISCLMGIYSQWIFSHFINYHINYQQKKFIHFLRSWIILSCNITSNSLRIWHIFKKIHTGYNYCLQFIIWYLCICDELYPIIPIHCKMSIRDT